MTTTTYPLEKLEFDQFHRYRAVAMLVRPLFQALGRPARVLEVGCNVLDCLPRVLGDWPLEHWRCDIEDHAGIEGNFVRLRPEEPLPFAGGSFDVVIALEVLEHVPPEDRRRVLAEWVRVAEEALIFSCPNGLNTVRRAEKLASQAFEIRNRRPHPWLAEHKQFGLPTEAEILTVMQELELDPVMIPNSPLAEWLPLLLLSEELMEQAGPSALEEFNCLINKSAGSAGDQAAYRSIYACPIGQTAIRVAHDVWLLPDNRRDFAVAAEPLTGLATRLREAFADSCKELATRRERIRLLEQQLFRLSRECSQQRLDLVFEQNRSDQRVRPSSPPRRLAALLALLPQSIRIGGIRNHLARARELLRQEGLRGFGRRLLARAAMKAPARSESSYHTWLARHEPSEQERRETRQRVRSSGNAPRFAILLPMAAFHAEDLFRTLDSIAGQDYDGLSLHLAVPVSKVNDLNALLAALPCKKRFLSAITPVPLPWSDSRALNRLLKEVEADYIIPLDQADQLAADALHFLADAILAQGRPLDLVYSDEDYWNPTDGRCLPHFKPTWSPEAYLATPYVGRLAAYRLTAVRQAGGFDPAFEGAHEMDLVLKLTAASDAAVLHVPKILHHRAGSPERCYVHADSSARVRRWHARHQVADVRSPRISIVIPTAGKGTMIRGRETPFVLNCVSSIRRQSSYMHYEIIVVDNGDLSDAVLRELKRLGTIRDTFQGPFNLAAKINQGGFRARGDYLVILNDDTEVISPDWLERMLDQGRRPGVGAVGACLLFPDGRLQHVGVHLFEQGPGHPWYGVAAEHPGYFGCTQAVRNFLAVTGACMMTPRDTFCLLGGYRPCFHLNYNDVDYCLRLRDRGLRAVYTPYAQLLHYEGVSKEGGAAVHPAEQKLFRETWGARYPRDPYLNPNLSPRHGDYRLRD